LVHDEAHLEPAFQKLIIAIENEQRLRNDFRPLRVMELSATSRGSSKVFTLTPEEQNPDPERGDAPDPLRIVWKRMTGKKGIKFHGVARSDVLKEIGRISLRHKDSGKAVLIFVRSIDDIRTVYGILSEKIKGVSPTQIQVLTGTLRGLERDRLATKDPIFQRFLLKQDSDGRTVFLLCTSAGEVGIDISADHMVCDLNSYESTSQKLGRVNRRGDVTAEVDVVYEIDPDVKKKDDPFEKCRWKTLELLERLPACAWNNERREASPLELGRLMAKLSDEERRAAFSPQPEILPTSDILFDAWALTTIVDKLPGRPPVEAYLHGITPEPPDTQIAWRQEVELLRSEEFGVKFLEELIEDYPLKPHELLRGNTFGKGGVFEQLEIVAKRSPNLNAWLIDQDGTLIVRSIRELVEKDKQKKPLINIGNRTVVLPPSAGGFAAGLLKGEEPFSIDAKYDVADEWYKDEKQGVRRRVRISAEDVTPPGVPQMRLVRTIDTKPNAEGENDGGDSEHFWHYYVRPESADDDGSKTGNREQPITWQHHTDDVVENAKQFLKDLSLPEKIQFAIVLAAKLHDYGKRRAVWQRSIGNPNPSVWYAKSARGWIPRDITDYRHEFGSLIDALSDAEITSLAADPELQDLVLHLIAVHHGRGRPHFPLHEILDPELKHRDPKEIAIEVMCRFARLQRKYGRWGLAYLESLLRAADYKASANPTAPEDKK